MKFLLFSRTQLIIETFFTVYKTKQVNKTTSRVGVWEFRGFRANTQNEQSAEAPTIPAALVGCRFRRKLLLGCRRRRLGAGCESEIIKKTLCGALGLIPWKSLVSAIVGALLLSFGGPKLWKLQSKPIKSLGKYFDDAILLCIEWQGRHHICTFV